MWAGLLMTVMQDWSVLCNVYLFARKSLTMSITIAAFEHAPDGGRGLTRDTRVRWALEEAGSLTFALFRSMR